MKTYKEFINEQNNSEIDSYISQLNNHINVLEDRWRICVSKVFDYGRSYILDELRSLLPKLENINRYIINVLFKNISNETPQHPIKKISQKIIEIIQNVKRILNMMQEAISLWNVAHSINGRSASMRLQELNNQISKNYLNSLEIIKNEIIKNLKKELINHSNQ